MVTWLQAIAMKKYPHFKPIETEIAKRFLRKYRIEGNYIFDFKLPVELPRRIETYPPEIRRALRSLKARRIDIVIETREMDYLVEIKERANAYGIGQLLAYKEIYTTKVKKGRLVQLLLVYAESDPDIEAIAKKFGITPVKV